MSGTPIDLVKKAIANLTEFLDKNDKLAIVIFNHESEILVDLT